MYKIGEVAELTGLSADTLRYYEKYGLLPYISRNSSGVREYDDKNISSLNFIKRAQRMRFSLDEIKALLSMREDPQHAKENVRKLTSEKLEKIKDQLTEITTLHNELQLLLNICRDSKDGCPIINNLNQQP